jgi:thioredoxin-like negative regulator of GroEL
VFDATKSKFRDVSFERVNLDERRDLGGQYGIHSIPTVVFLDNGGKALYVGSPARDEEAFYQSIQRFR